MINLLGFGKGRKGVKVTIEYCPKSITLPYKVKKLINKASLSVPEKKDNKDPFGFTEKTVRVGEFLNEHQVQHLVEKAQSAKSEFDSIEIVEGGASSIGEELLLD